VSPEGHLILLDYQYILLVPASAITDPGIRGKLVPVLIVLKSLIEVMKLEVCLLFPDTGTNNATMYIGILNITLTSPSSHVIAHLSMELHIRWAKVLQWVKLWSKWVSSI
jgi:hypothetical protein